MTIELEDHPVWERRAAYVQRAGWLLLGSIVIATLLGFFGPGPLGERKLESPGGLRLEYDHFLRMEAPATLHLTLPAATRERPRLQFLLDSVWRHGVHIETMVPEPERVEAEADGRLRYTMPTSARPLQVSVHFEPESWGKLEGSIGLVGEVPLTISQFSYP